MVFNDVDGIYTYTYEAEKKEDCLACSQIPQTLEIKEPSKYKLKDLIALLCESVAYQMKSPGLTTSIGGKNKTLYMSTIASIEAQTKENLNKSLLDLGIQDGSELMVADLTSPNTLVLKIKYTTECHDVDMVSS